MRFLSDKTLRATDYVISLPLSFLLSLTNHSFSALLTGAAAQDIYEYVPLIVRELIYRLNDDNSEVLKAGHKAWIALSTHVPAEESVKHIEFIRNLINSMVSESRRRKGGVGDGEFFLPGFNMPKGKLVSGLLSSRISRLRQNEDNFLF